MTDQDDTETVEGAQLVGAPGRPASEDDVKVRYAAERARRRLTIGAIRTDLEAQPSPRSILAAGRRWCAEITAMADAMAKQRRDTA